MLVVKHLETFNLYQIMFHFICPPHLDHWPHENQNQKIYFEEGLINILEKHPKFWNETEEIIIKIFPNPTEKYFTVATPYKIENCKIELFNVAGQNVLSEKLFSESTKIDVSNLSKGVYIYNILNGNKLKKSDKLLIY